MNYPGEARVLLALDHARADAARRGHDRIATRHLLLGLLKVRDGSAALTLRELGVDLDGLRREVERSLPRGGEAVHAAELGYSRNAQRAITVAVQEARNEAGARGSRAPGNHPVLRTEHLLLALLAIDGDVARMLVGAGAGREAVQGQLRRLEGLSAQSLPFLSINPAGPAPVYQQIVDQVREAVAQGRLRAEERLPTVRQLAAELNVAPGTAARAYQELEQLAVVVTDGSRGTRVAPPRSARAPRAERVATLVALLRPVAVAAAELGASADDVRGALEQALGGFLPRERDEQIPAGSATEHRADHPLPDSSP